MVIGLRMSRDVGPSRRDRSPSQGWGHRKGPGQWYVKRQMDPVLVGGSLVWALDEGLLSLTRDEEPGDARHCVGGRLTPGCVRGSRAPAVLGLSNPRNCSEIGSAALAERPVISPWHVCKC